MYNSYNKTEMPLFPNLSDEDIDAILFYIKIQSALLTLPIASVKSPRIPANGIAFRKKE